MYPVIQMIREFFLVWTICAWGVNSKLIQIDLTLSGRIQSRTKQYQALTVKIVQDWTTKIQVGYFL
jgi:hypothetical protein